MCTFCVALQQLPPLLASLHELHICQLAEGLEQLPPLPASLRVLVCENPGELKQLPPLPSSKGAAHQGLYISGGAALAALLTGDFGVL